jgi:multidrug efflux pump subunit AcrA (membrane-fusion protein)
MRSVSQKPGTEVDPGSGTTANAPPAGPAHDRREHPHRRAHLIAAIVVLVFLVLFLVGYLPRRSREKALELAARDSEARLPAVIVARAERAPARSELSLPGSIEAITEAPVLARAEGYLSKRYVDIGDRVQAGQLLAEIEAPELDQQVKQARAAFEQSQAALGQAQAALVHEKADEKLAAVTAERWNTLAGRGVVSRQENDQKQAAYQSAQAAVQAAEAAVKAAQENVGAAQANLDRLRQLQDYKRVRAPFTGLVTTRNVDTGTLISNGATVLFRVAQVGMLRTFINVPQSDQPAVHPGGEAAITVPQYPGRRFAGKVTRTASALDPKTRTLLAEVQVPNPDGLLLPGMYAEVTLLNLRTNPPILIPGDSVVAGASGTRVAVLGAGDIVHFQSIAIGRDYGTEVEVLSGLAGGEDVVVNPADDVREGARVRPTRVSSGRPGNRVSGGSSSRGGPN